MGGLAEAGNLVVDRFEYVPVGQAVLARVEGLLLRPALGVPELELVVSLPDGELRIGPLPDPGGSATGDDRWHAAFAATTDVVEAPGVKFALAAGDERTPLDRPIRRSLEAGADPAASETIVQRFRRELPKLVELQSRLERATADLANLRSSGAKQHAALRRELARARTERAEAVAAVAAERERAAELGQGADQLERRLESVIAEAIESADTSATADGANAVEPSEPEPPNRSEECLRELIATHDRVAESQSALEAARERLRTSLFEAGGEPEEPEAVMAKEQAMRELLSQERAALQEAWESARELVASERPADDAQMAQATDR